MDRVEWKKQRTKKDWSDSISGERMEETHRTLSPMTPTRIPSSLNTLRIGCVLIRDLRDQRLELFSDKLASRDRTRTPATNTNLSATGRDVGNSAIIAVACLRRGVSCTGAARECHIYATDIEDARDLNDYLNEQNVTSGHGREQWRSHSLSLLCK
jgi:hypothetical protein